MSILESKEPWEISTQLYTALFILLNHNNNCQIHNLFSLTIHSRRIVKLQQSINTVL